MKMHNNVANHSRDDVIGSQSRLYIYNFPFKFPFERVQRVSPKSIVLKLRLPVYRFAEKGCDIWNFCGYYKGIVNVYLKWVKNNKRGKEGGGCHVG